MTKVEWTGSRGLALNEYLHNKVELERLKMLPQRYRTEEVSEKTTKLEKAIKIFISSLIKEELQSIILMSLNIES